MVNRGSQRNLWMSSVNCQIVSVLPLFGALCFDEMSIRKCIELDGHNYIGFVNHGNNINSTELPVAKQALVFMLTCVNGSWKIPVGYVLIDGISAEQKASLVKQALDLIQQAGVTVISLTLQIAKIAFMNLSIHPSITSR